MWVKFRSNKQLWISTSAIFRKIKIFQIPSSIWSIMSLTNNPFFYFGWSSDELQWSRQNPFFGHLANLLYPTYFSIFSYKKFIISWNTYLSCGKTFVINYFNVWPKKILNNCFFWTSQLGLPVKIYADMLHAKKMRVFLCWADCTAVLKLA